MKPMFFGKDMSGWRLVVIQKKDYGTRLVFLRVDAMWQERRLVLLKDYPGEHVWL